ncbi:hypothetical protein DVH24_012488 [Malus domestica]|uniref:Uncharacterized protein n=1 Tax=Malus domestica TaxID=3750 RepID=A0A498HR84_MALDO|nr:hypothetical protein DVH24_012488 [Malus domestica]
MKRDNRIRFRDDGFGVNTGEGARERKDFEPRMSPLNISIRIPKLLGIEYLNGGELFTRRRINGERSDKLFNFKASLIPTLIVQLRVNFARIGSLSSSKCGEKSDTFHAMIGWHRTLQGFLRRREEWGIFLLEAEGVRATLLACFDRGFDVIQVETDSKELVDMINETTELNVGSTSSGVHTWDAFEPKWLLFNTLAFDVNIALRV